MSTLDLLVQLDALKERQSAKAHLLDGFLRNALNEELEVLATAALNAIDADPRDPLIMAAASRGSTDGVVIAVVSVMRRKFSKLCRDHQREEG